MTENFFETIFLKRNSYQEEHYNLIDKNKKNSNEKRLIEKGLQGEKEIEYHLNKSNIGMYVLRDINLEYSGMKAQIDYIVITSKHCYFIECKNYSGNIRVDESSNFTMSTRYGRRTISKGIYSPIRQVEAQLDVFLKICLDNQDKTKELLNGIRFKNYFKTLVVFTNSESILKMNKAPQDIKDRVIKVDNLIRIIEQDQKEETNRKLNQNQMKKMGDFLLEINKEKKVLKNDMIDNMVSNESTFNKKPIIKIAIIVYLLLIIISLILNSLSDKSSNNNSNPITQEKLTDYQLEALRIMRSGYEGSKSNGFDVLHTSICNQISSIYNYEIDCDRLPAYVNFKDADTITIKKNSTCYTIKFETTSKIIKSKRKEYVGNDIEHKCDGVPIGFFDWNPDNAYFKEIGGYEKIREMAIYAYNNNAFVTNYYDGSHLVERGGNPSNYTKYSMCIDMFFSGLTGRGYDLKSSTNREKTNEMCEALYYLGK